MRRLILAVTILIILCMNPASPILAKSTWPRVPILLFHHIDRHRGKWHVTPQQFEKELAYLARAGYHTISMDTYLDAIQNNATLPTKPIILTFDDGYQDNFDNAIPLLQKYGMTGTFYVISGMVGNAAFMTWGELMTMEKDGMEIGAHTVHHPFLTRLPILKALSEIWLSKRDIQNHLGVDVRTFAYPYNDRNATVEELVRMSDYRDAVVVGPHRGDVYDDTFMIHRITIFQTEGVNAFEAAVRS